MIQRKTWRFAKFLIGADRDPRRTGFLHLYQSVTGITMGVRFGRRSTPEQVEENASAPGATVDPALFEQAERIVATSIAEQK